MKIKAGIDVRFGNGYRLTSDALCYCLETVGINEDTDSKNYGKETFSLIGYYTSIANVFVAMTESEVRNCGAETITELGQEIERIKKELGQIAENNLKMTVVEKREAE